MHQALSALWFFLPAGAANMAPIMFNRVPILDSPVDFGKKFKGQPIFGPHKTYRGLLFGWLVGTLIVFLQTKLGARAHNYNLVNYQSYNIWLLGFLLSAGALAGDLAKSFFKRRLNVAAGKSWVPYDQIDWILGAIILTSPIVSLSFWQLAAALVVYGFSHPISNLLGYYLKFKSNKF